MRKGQAQCLVVKRTGRALDHLSISTPIILKWGEVETEKGTLPLSGGRLPELLQNAPSNFLDISVLG